MKNFILLFFPKKFSFLSTEGLVPPPSLQVDGGLSFQVKVRFDTDIELGYYNHKGILNFMVRKMVK